MRQRLVDLGHELRFALRTLRRSPAFTAAGAATLALAIGASTAMFSVVNAVLLRPLPYRLPLQLAILWTEIPTQNLREGRAAYVAVEEWRRQSRSFADIAVVDPVSATLTTADETEQVSVARISANFLPLLGVEPLHGRTFSAAEADQRQRLALISQRLWQTHFAGSLDAIGASITLDGRPSQIIGILPAAFQLARLGKADVWEPHTMFPDWESRRRVGGADSWFVVGRLRPDVTVGRAQEEMNAIARRLDDQVQAAVRPRGISVVPLSLYELGSRPRLALWMLAGAVGCVLLIAVANVASLSLARAVGRAREMAVRAALGASSARLVRQLLFESTTLAVISSIPGAVLALAAIRLIRRFGPRDLPHLNEVSLDLGALGWALAISLLAGVVVGLAPALTMVRTVRPSGEEGGRSVSGGTAIRRIRRALVVAEFALAIVLLTGAGLLIRSWRQLERVDLGFRPERTLSMQLSTAVFTETAPRVAFYTSVLEQIEALPGVDSAGIVGDLFIGGSAERLLTSEGDGGTRSERLRFRRDEVSERFFSTVGTPLRRGRLFSIADGPEAPRVAIVNEALARRLWPGHDAVGGRFTLGPADPDAAWFTVVGVVGDMRRQGLENEPIPQMFEPLAQNPSRLATLLVRTSLEDPLTMIGTLRAAVRRVDTHVPLYGVTTVADRLGVFLAERRFQTALLIGFSVIALLMAAIGIFGLIQYSVAARTHEIGIRVAVGAQAGGIFRMILGEGLRLSLAGLGLGLIGALWVGQAGSSLLFGVTATDPWTFTAVPLVLMAVAIAACWLPARRAMKIAPVTALRHD